jgi:endonuclease IV
MNLENNKIGRHLSFEELQTAKGPTQIFAKSPYSLKFKTKLRPDDFGNFKYKLYFHGPYSINLGKKIDKKTMNLLVENILDDIHLLEKIGGGRGVILHYGRGNEYVKNTELNIQRILELTDGRHSGKCKIIIENVKGTKIGDMLQLQKKFPGKIGICFDTCHLFISGYELEKPKIAAEIFWEIKRQFPDLMLIHFNDAAFKNKDVHEFPGLGYIGNKKMGGNIKSLRIIRKILKDTDFIYE